MRILAHPDPFVVEETLLDHVGEAQADDPLAPVLVIVPTRRLAAHVQRRIAERFGGRLGVHVLHYRAMILRILESEGATPARVLSRRLREAALQSTIDSQRDEPWAEFVGKRPGALAGLLGAFNDLREAGITTEQAMTVLRRDERERSLGRLYTAFVGTLDRLRDEHGLEDDATFARRAAAGAERFASSFAGIFHHGAYELIGLHLDLLQALDRGTAVTVFLPVEPGAPAAAYAERFVHHYLLGKDETVTRIQDRPGGLFGNRLAALYDEGAATDPVEPGRVVLRNTQGDDAELTAATRRALGVVADETPPWELAVLSRSLVPYASSIQGASASAAPLASSARVPLRRQPAVHDLLVLLRAVNDNFPRAATVELLRSPRVCWQSLGVSRPPGDRAEAWSRQAKILEGLDSWVESLPRWAEESIRTPDDASEEEQTSIEERRRLRREQAELIGRSLEALWVRLTDGRPDSWREHAKRLDALVREVIPGDSLDSQDEAIRELRSILQDMRDLDSVEPMPGEIRLADAVRWLEQTVDRTEIDLASADAAGIRVLDFMQARGLTFRRVWIVGMNERLFPRVSREDPFLSDGARRRLMEATKRPLPLTAGSSDEERLLLSMMLGAARERTEISWQRADDTGKSKTPSLALREVARIVSGTPDLTALVAAARRMSSHPRRWIEALIEESGMLDPGEERALVALRSDTPDTALKLLRDRSPGLRGAMEMLTATESFVPGNFAYDGRIGADIYRPDHFSPTSLDTLGLCPLKYFFRRVLRLRELDEEPSPYQIDAREMGESVHRLLERLYRTLLAEGLLSPANAESASRRSSDLVPSLWHSTLGRFERRIGQRLPLLGRQLAARWSEVIESFVPADIQRIADENVSITALESLERGEIDLGTGTRINLVVRFDRVATAEGRSVVSDYKTSGDLSKRVNITQMLKGKTFQVPLYWMLSGGDGTVELLGVGPDYLGAGGKERRVEFSGFENGRQEEGFRETLRTLKELVDIGSFPTSPGRHCDWCDYRQACRRKHPPTEERETHAPDGDDWRHLEKKSKTKHSMLSDVRGSDRAERSS